MSKSPIRTAEAKLSSVCNILKGQIQRLEAAIRALKMRIQSDERLLAKLERARDPVGEHIKALKREIAAEEEKLKKLEEDLDSLKEHFSENCI